MDEWFSIIFYKYFCDTFPRIPSHKRCLRREELWGKYGTLGLYSSQCDTAITCWYPRSIILRVTSPWISHILSPQPQLSINTDRGEWKQQFTDDPSLAWIRIIRVSIDLVCCPPEASIRLAMRVCWYINIFTLFSIRVYQSRILPLVWVIFIKSLAEDSRSQAYC